MFPVKKRQLQAARQRVKARQQHWERCECCKQRKSDVKRRIDPFAAAMDDNKPNGDPSDPVYLNACLDCLGKRAEEV